MISARWFAGAAGAGAIVACFVVLLLPIRLDAMYQGNRIDCGTAMSLNLLTADQADIFSAMVAPIYGSTPSDNVADCQSRANTRRAIAIPLGAVGALAVLAALMVRSPTPTAR